MSGPSGTGGMNVDPTTLLGGGGVRRQLLTTTIAVLLGLLIGALLILVSSQLQGNPFDITLPVTAFEALFRGSLGTDRAIANTLNQAAPLILAGLSVAFGFRAALFNIGAQGQFFVGAFAAALIGAYLKVPAPIHLPLAILGGLLGGAAWGFIPGVLKAWRGAHEVVTTIMLNSVAALWLNLLASTLFLDAQASFPRTPDVAAAATLPIIWAGTRLHLGIVIAVVTAILIWVLLFKTTLGFEIRMVGVNPSAARYAGIRPAVITVLTMSLAGGLAGLAGMVEILGITKNYPAEYNSTYGFDGIAVALLGRAHPAGVVGAALLFALLRTGAGTMQRATDIPVDIITIIQGVIILFVAAEVVIKRLLPAARGARAQAEPAAA
jgi:simple sugar transport system permease protein